MANPKAHIPEIVDYLKKNLKKGYTKDSLKWALISQGYTRLEVEKAIKKLDLDLANEAPILKTKPEIKYEVIDSDHKIEIKKGLFWKRMFKS